MAANTYINLYTGTVTAGGTDGSLISNGDNSSPLSLVVNSSDATPEAKAACAIRCQPTYNASNVTLSFDGTNAAQWSISDTENGTYGATLTLPSDVLTTNTIFWVKATATAGEDPKIDTSVKIKTVATISKVASGT
jgi:hypothetical protein